MAALAAVVLLAQGCGGSNDDVAATTLSPTSTAPPTTLGPTTTTSTTTAPTTTAEALTTTTVESGDQVFEIASDEGLVYLTDDVGDWTLKVFYPIDDGPWPLIVVIPPQMKVDYAAQAMAKRGAVTVVADSWTIDGWSDPGAYINPEMDRAACVVGWAQAHAADYGASAESTTVDGYSGGGMAATWVGLGLADDTSCPHQINELPTGLVVGESQPLFHHQRWDPSFASGDSEPRAVLDGFFNPQNWNVSPDLRVALWSAENPMAETRSVDNPPGDDSWLWLREAATPFVDDLIALGALDDERVDWADNARLMEYRMQQAGVDVQNVTYDIGHAYTKHVYDLIFSIQN